MANFAFVTPSGQYYQAPSAIASTDSMIPNASPIWIATLPTQYPSGGQGGNGPVNLVAAGGTIILPISNNPLYKINLGAAPAITTWLLPSPSALSIANLWGHHYRYKDNGVASAYNQTFQGQNGMTIDGNATLVMTVNETAYDLVPDLVGMNWSRT